MGLESPTSAKLIAEFTGTFLLIFTVGCNVLSKSGVWAGTSIACVLMVAIFAFGGTSGANFNPAVSVALGINGNMEWKDVGIYSAVQLVGGIAAGFAYFALFGSAFNLAPAKGFNAVSAGACEVLYTFMLCFVVLNVAAVKKGCQAWFGLAIGFVIVAGAYGAGAVSGGCFNPAVAFGIDVSSAQLGFGWCVAYTVFEIIGAALAAGLFKVLFYNAGSESIQASVVEYSTFVEGTKVKNKTIGQFEVLGKGWARGAGGFHVDLALAEKIADAFNEQWKKKKKGKAGDVRTLARPMAKIRASAKKTKEVLSANEKIPVNIPSLHDDIDFHMMVTRKDLEAAAADVLAKAMQPVQDALAKANATVDDLHGVEIIGGGVRVPKIQEMLRDFFTAGRTNKSDPLELGLHLNGDEAPALGAAFHGANVSTSFRVRKVGMLDYAQHALGVRMTNDLYAESVREGGGLMGFFKGGTKKKDDGDESPEDWHKRATLFKAGARLGAKPRTIAFHHDADIVCELAYDDVDKLPPGTPKTVALYNISGIAAFAADMAKQNTTGQLPRPKVQLSFTLDASGIASLSKAEVSVVEEYEVDAPPPKAEPKAEDNATAENATEANATDAAEATEAAKDDDKPAE